MSSVRQQFLDIQIVLAACRILEQCEDQTAFNLLTAHLASLLQRYLEPFCGEDLYSLSMETITKMASVGMLKQVEEAHSAEDGSPAKKARTAE